MLELSESFFDTGQVRLHVLEGPPAGPALVLLHASSTDWTNWSGLLPQLLQHWHVYALDLRGHGQSGRAADAAGYHLSAFAADVVAFLQGQVRQPALLFGQSWGALTALLCGAPAKELVSGLVLEDPPIGIRRDAGILASYMEYFGKVRAWLQAYPKLADLQRSLRREYPHMQPEALAQWANALHHTDPLYLEAVLAGSAVTHAIDFDRAIREIACPILLLRSDLARGGALEDEDVDLLRRNARHLQVVYFEGVGHFIDQERPARVLELLAAFPPKA